MELADRRPGSRGPRPLRDAAHEWHGVPADGAAMADTHPPVDENTGDLVTIAQAHQIPAKVKRGAKLWRVDIGQ